MNTARYVVADSRHSECSIDLYNLDWSRWFTDGTEGRLYLHVYGPDEAIVRVWCRYSDYPRLELYKGQLLWLVDNKRFVMKNRHLGKIRIDFKLLEEPNRVARIFSIMNFVPTRAECLYHSNDIEYVGISETFDFVNFGDICPEYQLEIEDDEQGWPIHVVVRKK